MQEKQTISLWRNKRVWLTYLVKGMLIFIVSMSYSMADQWKGFGNLGTANDCENSIIAVCLQVDNAAYNTVVGDVITVKTPSGETVTAQWQGITISYQGRIGTTFSDYPLCETGKCEVAVVVGETSSACTSTGCFSGNMPNPNGGCQQPGISCGVLGVPGALTWWARATGGHSTNFSGFNSSVKKVNSIQGSTSQPLWVLVVDGPSRRYTLPGGGSVYGYTQNTPIPLALSAAADDSTQGDVSAFSASAGVDLVIVAPPVEEPDVYCEFSTDGDIDLGIVDPSNASNRYASTYLYTQCTDDATVTAKIQKSGGGNNLLQMGGLDLRVIFDNSSDTKTYAANTNRDSQVIWGQVTSVGTLTPGEYSQSMIVHLNYE